MPCARQREEEEREEVPTGAIHRQVWQSMQRWSAKHTKQELLRSQHRTRAMTQGDERLSELALLTNEKFAGHVLRPAPAIQCRWRSRSAEPCDASSGKQRGGGEGRGGAKAQRHGGVVEVEAFNSKPLSCWLGFDVRQAKASAACHVTGPVCTDRIFQDHASLIPRPDVNFTSSTFSKKKKKIIT